VTDVQHNADGWIKHDVLVSFPASDALSGLALSSPDVHVSTEGAAQDITGTAEDNAGNQATAIVTLNIDKTAPDIALASRTPAANPTGWNNTDVNFTWDCTDALSGAASPSVTRSVSSEGAAQMVIGTCTDLADNSASDTQAGINIDKTAPAIQGSPSPAPNANGWNNSDVAVSFTCSDPLSGLAAGSPPANAVLTTDGAGQSVTDSCSDIAGNSASATVSDINLDKTAPTAAGTPGRAPDSNDWYNHLVTVAWNGTDALSGIASCSAASNYAGPDSASASVNGACTDQAGNSTGAIVSFKFDATKPAINIANPSSGAAYLLNAAVNADYGCTDTASGVQSCSGPVASGAAVNTASVGAKQFTVNSRDVAGNTASATHNYSVHYAFSGFANPIGPMPMVNVANAGRTVPVKYSLQDANGALISDLASFVSLMSGPVACNATAPGVLAEETDAAGSTTMRYTGNEFHYNWKTDKSWAGTCRALQLTLSDGAQHWAMFQFK
ncbi:MAG: PxKF domain-containing protein, partial [Candidatus Acidiferrales bacterium]